MKERKGKVSGFIVKSATVSAAHPLTLKQSEQRQAGIFGKHVITPTEGPAWFALEEQWKRDPKIFLRTVIQLWTKKVKAAGGPVIKAPDGKERVMPEQPLLFHAELLLESMEAGRDPLTLLYLFFRFGKEVYASSFDPFDGLIRDTLRPLAREAKDQKARCRDAQRKATAKKSRRKIEVDAFIRGQYKELKPAVSNKAKSVKEAYREIQDRCACRFLSPASDADALIVSFSRIDRALGKKK